MNIFILFYFLLRCDGNESIFAAMEPGGGLVEGRRLPSGDPGILLELTAVIENAEYI